MEHGRGQDGSSIVWRGADLLDHLCPHTPWPQVRSAPCYSNEVSVFVQRDGSFGCGSQSRRIPEREREQAAAARDDVTRRTHTHTFSIIIIVVPRHAERAPVHSRTATGGPASRPCTVSFSTAFSAFLCHPPLRSPVSRARAHRTADRRVQSHTPINSPIPVPSKYPSLGLLFSPFDFPFTRPLAVRRGTSTPRARTQTE